MVVNASTIIKSFLPTGPTGPMGTSGYSGAAGAAGASGVSGYSGTSGYSGVGVSGISGYSGTSGYSAPSGISGYSGTSGYSALSGVSGYSGTSGTSGVSGYSGAGSSGYSGTSGYSGSGGVQPWALKSTNYTAVTGDRLLANTSGGTFTITLPATPSTGNSVQIADAADWATTNLTVARNGSTIEGLTEDLTMDVQGASVEFVYDGSTWEIFATMGTGTSGIVTLTGTQVLTNKTLTNPTINNYTEGVVAVGTVTSSHTFDLTNGTVQTVTLTASTACTFTMPTATAGKSFVVYLKQPAVTGNGSATFTSVKWSTSGAPTITTAAGSMDILSFVCDGTNWYGSYTQGYTP